jgi:predicted DNA-binding transcriptional regulator YafY
MRSIQISDLEARYFLEDFPQLSSDVYISQKNDVEIEVELAPEAYELASYLKELPKPDDSGWIRVNIRLGHLENLPRLIASFGGKARVIGPKVAKHLVRDFAARALNKPIELGESSE